MEKVLPTVMSRLSAILACLLALVVASPLCCCAAEGMKAPESCCCGGGESPENQDPGHRCLCASDDPREIPDSAVVPPQGLGNSLGCPPASPVMAFPGNASAGPDRPRWTPSLPWHAPPAQRRARLMSRLI